MEHNACLFSTGIFLDFLVFCVNVGQAEGGVGNPGTASKRPRVLVTLGGLPAGPGRAPAKGRVRVPYKQFLLIYSGKASARDIGNLAMQRKVCFLFFHWFGFVWVAYL